jgi:hypothetical protein
MVKVVGDVPGSAVGCRQALLLPAKGSISFHLRTSGNPLAQAFVD